MELLTEYSKIRLESAKIHYDGHLCVIFLEYIDRLDGGIQGLRQIDFPVAYRNMSVFENPLIAPYKEAAIALWDLRDRLYQASRAGDAGAI